MTDAKRETRVLPDILTLPILTFDLGGNVIDGDGLSSALEQAGFPTVPAEEDRLWRQAFLLGRRRVIQLQAFEIETKFAPLQALPAEMRIHPVGVIAIRFSLGIRECSGFRDAWELVERVAEWRDMVGDRFFRNAVSDDEVVLKVRRIQEIARPFLEPRPFVSRRNALNALQVVEVLPENEAVRYWVDQFSRFQGRPLGPDGDILTSEHVRLARWEEAAVCHLDGGQSLVITASAYHRSNAVSAYERSHVLRFWLRMWIELLEQVGTGEPKGRLLAHQDVKSLSLEHLRVTELRDDVTRALAEVDDRNFPLSSVFGRQLTKTFSRMFEIEEWKRSLVERLEAAAARSSFIGTVLEREFQLSAHRQNEKLQLLFAGSLAATIMALLPALVALTGPRDPSWPWIVATVVGTVSIWAFTAYLVVRRWKVWIVLDDRAQKEPRRAEPLD